MPKRLLVFMILILFLLAACSGDGQTPVDRITPVIETPAPEGKPDPTVVEPTEIKPTTSDPGTTATLPATGLKMECTLVSDQPDAPAELVAIFGVTENDWVKGPDTAAVTFVEYSDFQ